MITEDYVSFETAKLLKEKRFNEATYTYYLWGGSFYLSPIAVDNKNLYAHGHVSAPTLQMAMKWLREEHNLVVNPVGRYVDGKLEAWEVDIYFLDCGVDATINAMEHIYGKTYEEACEAAIKYCLENLI